jgi:hypothetical protein
MFGKSVNDTSRVVKIMTNIGDATPWSITYDHHSDMLCVLGQYFKFYATLL